MLLVVLVALETFEDVVGLAPSGLHRGLSGAVRACSGAADEHHRLGPFFYRCPLADDTGVGPAAGIGLPLESDTPGDLADIQQLGLRAYVDQLGAGLH